MANLRNPSTTIASLNEGIASEERAIALKIKRAETERDDPHQYDLLSLFKKQMDVFLKRYARGDAIDELAHYFMSELLPAMRHAQQLSSFYFPDHKLRLYSSEPWGYPFLFALVCFDKVGTELQRIDEWLDLADGPVLFDILLKAFVPHYAYAKKYQPQRNQDGYEIPVITAIVGEEAKRQSALASFMGNWPKLMKPYGYREHFSEQVSAFTHLPINAGLAVCAYDIDDTPFRDQLFYPRELVAYYRAHIRDTRDAWRACGIGAGPELPFIPQLAPRKVHSLKPAEAYARWVELACGDDATATAAARMALGKRKTMPELGSVMEALSALGMGTFADLKDDATLAHQAEQLCVARGLPPFVAPPAPPEGPARCSALLSALTAWLAEHGKRLVVVDDGGDAWQAVCVRAEDEVQFLELCEQLSVDVMDEAAWR
ncbi:DUF1911 domain-containing protein [Chitinimonas arctica]|uniref:DUF1911 domain-containing protein n=1 Tax=Chitinimonas arctica TaxID=2594795 RepID=A0A516SBD1_9NEIS|nr:PoNe immunity protein domain-containing protein [Chitinimonas arctica]QDQ25449.1 DUF1911 domain-containing protein [Chitinimonas arctica]